MTTFITKKTVIFLTCVLAVIVPISGITGCSNQIEPVNLNVLAAGSLSKVLNEVNDLFHQSTGEIKITAIFAASGDLVAQIENGAPADLFISASPSHMNRLEEHGLILTETRMDLLGNKIVLAVPRNSTLEINGFADLSGSDISLIAIGDPQFVPAGEYGKQSIELSGIDFDSLLPKMTLTSNVMQILSYLENESVDAGILFATDVAFSEKVRVVATAPDKVNNKIVYPAAVIATGNIHEAAEQYLNFLSGKEAAAIFEKYGFLVLTE